MVEHTNQAVGCHHAASSRSRNTDAYRQQRQQAGRANKDQEAAQFGSASEVNKGGERDVDVHMQESRAITASCQQLLEAHTRLPKHGQHQQHSKAAKPFLPANNVVVCDEANMNQAGNNCALSTTRRSSASLSPGMQLSPHTVNPGTGVVLPGHPAPLAAEMAGPGVTYTKTHRYSHLAPLRQGSCM